MSTPVRVRRLTDAEGRELQRIVRRGSGKSDNSVVKWRRALVVLASAGGNDVAVIARMVQTSPDRVREMIHRFNEKGMKSLDPAWAGGRPRRIRTTERALIVSSATARPHSLSPAGACASSAAISRQGPGSASSSRPSACARSSPRRRSPSRRQRPGRSPPIRSARRSSRASTRCSRTTASGPLPSTSSARS